MELVRKNGSAPRFPFKWFASRHFLFCGVVRTSPGRQNMGKSLFYRGPGLATSFSQKGSYVGVSGSVRGSPFSPKGKDDRACRSAKHRPHIASAYISRGSTSMLFFWHSLFFGGATFCNVPLISTSASAASAWRYFCSMYVLVFGDHLYLTNLAIVYEEGSACSRSF